MATAVTVTASGVEVGAVRPLDLPAGPWDVSPDGQHFLIAAPEHEAITPITLVVNWPAGLKH